MVAGWRFYLLALVLGAAGGARLAWLWQADELDKQAVRYQQKLTEKDLVHGREREAAAVAVLDQKAIEQAQRRGPFCPHEVRGCLCQSECFFCRPEKIPRYVRLIVFPMLQI